jgi:hypothetical protein
MKQGNKKRKNNKTRDIWEERPKKRPPKDKLIRAGVWDKTSTHFLTIRF